MIAPGTHNYRKGKLSMFEPYRRITWIRIPNEDRTSVIGIDYRSNDPNVFKHYELLKTRYGTWLTTWKGDSGNIYFDLEVPSIYKPDIMYAVNQLISPKQTVR